MVGFCSQDKNAFRKYLGKNKKQFKHLNDDLGGYNNNFFFFFLIFQRMKTKTFHNILLNFNIEKIDIERIDALFYLEIYVCKYIYIYIYLMKTCIYFN